MKHYSRQYLISAAGGAIAALALTMPGLSAAQQSDRTSMEETTITSRQDGIEMERLHGRTTGVQTRARAVSYADLNLERKAGLDTLYSRLETASREVCSPRESYRTWAMSQDWQACYTHAMDKAVADVGNLDLQDYHLARIDEAVEAAEQVSDRR